jgi:hypothetical protein
MPGVSARRLLSVLLQHHFLLGSLHVRSEFFMPRCDVTFDEKHGGNSQASPLGQGGTSGGLEVGCPVGPNPSRPPEGFTTTVVLRPLSLRLLFPGGNGISEKQNALQHHKTGTRYIQLTRLNLSTLRVYELVAFVPLNSGRPATSESIANGGKYTSSSEVETRGAARAPRDAGARHAIRASQTQVKATLPLFIHFHGGVATRGCRLEGRPPGGAFCADWSGLSQIR